MQYLRYLVGSKKKRRKRSMMASHMHNPSHAYPKRHALASTHFTHTKTFQKKKRKKTVAPPHPSSTCRNITYLTLPYLTIPEGTPTLTLLLPRTSPPLLSFPTGIPQTKKSLFAPDFGPLSTLAQPDGELER